ncbi:MAG: hypothetical protein ACRDTJ_18110 [Pseudonocardiaceae bacterium]
MLHAEQLAPQLIHTDVFVRETIADLLRQARIGSSSPIVYAALWSRA